MAGYMLLPEDQAILSHRQLSRDQYWDFRLPPKFGEELDRFFWCRMMPAATAAWHRRSSVGWDAAARGPSFILSHRQLPCDQYWDFRLPPMFQRRHHSNCSLQTSISAVILGQLLSVKGETLSYADLLYGGWVQMDWQIKVRNCHKLMSYGNLYAWCLTRSPHGLRNWQQSLLWWPVMVEYMVKR
jgi:hypothetical protein